MDLNSFSLMDPDSYSYTMDPGLCENFSLVSFESKNSTSSKPAFSTFFLRKRTVTGLQLKIL
jgi:hypothetical protein